MPKKQKRQRQPNLIGLSLSQCVADILNDKVEYDRVQKIITGTACSSEYAWKKLLRKEYKNDHWHYRNEREQHRQAVRLTNRLRSEGKIEQPRLTTGKCPEWQVNAWVKSEKEIVWFTPYSLLNIK